jgi:fibro-slime domain-containing protein
MTNPSGSYGWAKAGIMIRQSLNSNSQYVMAIATSTNGVTFQSRKNAGDTTRQTIISSVSVPVWLELKRTGNIFTVAYSTNDISWTTINKDTIAMTDPVYAGLAVTSHTTSTLEPAVFSNFSGVPQSFTDTIKIGKDSVPVIYTVTKLGANLFNMSTDAYFLKGTNSAHNYETQLNQLLSRQTQGTWTETARDSAIIPVTLYDFRSDNSSPEFQVPGQGMKNMLQCTLDVDRKPIPQIPLASFRSCILATYTGGAPYCFGSDWYTVSTGTRNTRYLTIDWHPDCINNCKSSNPPGNNGWWFNDSMRAWFRPWGDLNPMGGGYTYDPLSCRWSGLKMRPNWTPNFPGEDTEWVGQNWDSTNHFANIVMYDSLTFRQQKAPKDTTVFTFGDSSWIYKQDSVWFVKGCNCTLKVGYWVGWWDTITMYFPPNEYKFMPLKNRGFKYDASKWFPKGYNSCVDKCNFSYTMEIHRKFTYKPGQTFYFRGDDDVWGYINNHCVIDIGGTHTVDSENVMLDTIHPALVSGQEYWFDFFYCERNVDKSNIYISTNMLMFVPPQPLKRSWTRNYGNLD